MLSSFGAELWCAHAEFLRTGDGVKPAIIDREELFRCNLRIRAPPEWRSMLLLSDGLRTFR